MNAWGFNRNTENPPLRILSKVGMASWLMTMTKMFGFEEGYLFSGWTIYTWTRNNSIYTYKPLTNSKITSTTTPGLSCGAQ